ncbi:hypothetical protein NliqN6_1036 [Naganishia liquefaciens]|uniref:Palmitoyltransferase n=1 Tax=Naganishia liquefaciens TaxID=104408 RepID=A0A8H3TQV6_9TREE|nr:hypothetical protein NliqN6_1036 [Naganishia liquefaciens]
MWPWYGRVFSVDLIKAVLPLNVSGVLIFWNYYLCVSTDPGHVPSGWMLKQTNRRAGVGFRNQGHFLRFLVWVDFGMACHIVIILSRMRAFATWSSPEPTTADVLWMVINLAIGVPVWLCVGIFSLYHLYIAAGNSTTIEGWEKDRVATLVRRGKIKEIKYPYNLGFYRNLQSVLGPNPLLWLWPQSMSGDGLSFPVSEAVTAWNRTPHPAQLSMQHSIMDHLLAAWLESTSNLNVSLTRILVSDLFSQHAWPPRDPDRDRPIRTLPAPGSNPFTYGESFNPALTPSNAVLRSRRPRSSNGGGLNLDHTLDGENHDGEHYSSGEERDHCEQDTSSDRYPSSIESDQENAIFDEEDHNRQVRLRRGSEGYEVRAMTTWDWMKQLDEPYETCSEEVKPQLKQ